MEIKIDIKGLEGVEDALAQAGPRLAKRALRKGLLAGGQVMLEEAKARAPVAVEGTPQRKPGELRDSLVMKTKMSAKQEAGILEIGPEYKKEDGQQSPGVYGKFVEFGSIHNPQPRPFLRNGFDGSNQQALEKFTEVMREGVESLKEK